MCVRDEEIYHLKDSESVESVQGAQVLFEYESIVNEIRDLLMNIFAIFFFLL
jgi:hypothetical protein